MADRDIYFQFFVDDWLLSDSIDTMTVEQEGAFIRLLARSWRNPGCSLPDDDAKLARLSRLNERWEEVGAPVRSMFVKHPDKDHRNTLTNLNLYRQWLDRQEFKQTKADAGKRSGESRRIKRDSVRTEDEQKTNENEPLSDRIGSDRIGSSQDRSDRDESEEKISVPEGTSPSAEATAGPPCPVQKIIELHNEARKDAPPGIDEPEIRKSIVARWKQDKARQDLAWWGAYFHRVERSDFLSGRSEGMERPFVASLAWLVGPKNMSKVLAGNYDNRAPPPGANRFSKIGRKAANLFDSMKLPEPSITATLQEDDPDEETE